MKSIPTGRTFNPEEYEYPEYLPTYPVVDYAPHVELQVTDRGFNADPEYKALFGAATRVFDLEPSIGTQIDGIDLRQLTDQQKDELALLAAKRGVVVFRNQKDTSIKDLLDIGAYFGPLHVHSTTGVPKDPDLKAVHIVFSNGTKKPDPINTNRIKSWHTDQPYEINPPGLTSLKVITTPAAGGDTVWCSSAAVLSSFSKPFQEYLSKLYALQSSEHQKLGAIRQGTYIRRPQTDFVHPVVRVHPVTGVKALYVNPSYTHRIVGVPQPESDGILKMIYDQMVISQDYQVRVKWEKDQVVFWDNRVLWHTATSDFYPEKRHGLRATAVGERPISVANYEKTTGKKAKDWYTERMRELGDPVDEEQSAPEDTQKISGSG